MSESEDLRALYAHRFSASDRKKKDRIWAVLCESYFQRLIDEDDTVLDLACGQGEFIRHIRCGQKIAVDLNPEVRDLLPPEIRYVCARADQLTEIANDSVDVCFVSNFFEHLSSKAEMNAVLAEILRVLRSGGRLINMQPNVRYEPGRYWDFYDHVLPLSHLSAAEGLAQQGYIVERVIPRFLPFTTKSALPTHPALVRAYLAFPPIWRVMGGQFLIIGRKP